MAADLLKRHVETLGCSVHAGVQLQEVLSEEAARTRRCFLVVVLIVEMRNNSNINNNNISSNNIAIIDITIGSIVYHEYCFYRCYDCCYWYC